MRYTIVSLEYQLRHRRTLQNVRRDHVIHIQVAGGASMSSSRTSSSSSRIGCRDNGLEQTAAAGAVVAAECKAALRAAHPERQADRRFPIMLRTIFSSKASSFCSLPHPPRNYQWFRLRFANESNPISDTATISAHRSNASSGEGPWTTMRAVVR